MKKTVNIRVLGHEEVISCEEEEVESLVRAVELLDREANTIKQSSSQTLAFDKLLLLASLNLINRFLQSERQTEAYSQSVSSLLNLRPQLHQVLTKANGSSVKKS